MKEVLTKSFWDGVKKTFDDALEGQPPAEAPAPADASAPADGGDAKTPSTPEPPPTTANSLP